MNRIESQVLSGIAPASDVTSPPSKAATIVRSLARPKSIASALQRVGVGEQPPECDNSFSLNKFYLN